MPLQDGANAGLNEAPEQTGQVVQLLQKLLESQKGGASGLTSLQPSPSTGSLPPHMAPPGQINFGQPTGGFNSSGERKRADRQALIQGVSNTVAKATNFLNAKRDRTMQMTMERVFDAQAGLIETQGMLKEAQQSNDPAKIKEAQDAVNKNQEILSHIFDPTTAEGKKNLKMYEKVHSVNIVGESKDKNSPEYQNYIKSLQKWIKEGKQPSQNPVVQSIQNQQPIRQQLSPDVQAQAAAIKAKVLPEANTQLQQQMENFRQAVKSGTSEEIAGMIAKTADKRLKGQMLMQIRNEKSKKEQEEIYGKWHLEEARIRVEGMLAVQDKITQRVKASRLGENKDMANLYKQYQASVSMLAQLEAQLTGANKFDIYSPGKYWSKESVQKRTDIEGKINAITSMQASIMNKMSTLSMGQDAGMQPNLGTQTDPLPPDSRPSDSNSQPSDDSADLDEMYQQALEQNK